jgi:Transposase DDE domain group 1
VRHRRRARCEDRIRAAKDTGLHNLPLHGFAQNQIWCELVAMACELLAWKQLLALDRPARAWEPKRLRLFCAAGRIVRGGGQSYEVGWPRPGSGPPDLPIRQRAQDRLSTANSPASKIVIWVQSPLGHRASAGQIPKRRIKKEP